MTTEMQHAYTVPITDPWSEWFANNSIVSSFVSGGSSSIPFYYITFK